MGVANGKEDKRKQGVVLNIKIHLYFISLLLLLLVVGCNASSDQSNDVEVDEIEIEEEEVGEVDDSKDNQNIEWTIYVEGDEVVTNQLKCNDITGKEIPSHLIQICNYYEKLEPLSQEQKMVLYNRTGALAARDAFNRDIPLGHGGFAEGLEDYGEYLLHQYLYWRTGSKPNAKGEFKTLNQTSDFDAFFKLDVDKVKNHYASIDSNNRGIFETLLEAIEYEITVVNRMKHLNLEEPFNTWADETVAFLLEATQLYHQEQYNDSYLKYSAVLKRIHDLYFSIPEHNHLTG